jgi:hypothetical protein
VSSDEILPLRRSDSGWQVQLREPRHWLTVETRQEVCRIAGALPLAYTILHECEPTVGTLRELLECQEVLDATTKTKPRHRSRCSKKRLAERENWSSANRSDSSRWHPA